MDKKTKNNANAVPLIEHLNIPKGIRPVHQKYGLWICKFCREKSSNPISSELLTYRTFAYYDLSHMFEGRGWYCSADGTKQSVEKGDGILLAPGEIHKYGGDKEPYVEDAISFFGPVADNLFSTGVIRNGVFKIGNARRLLPIIELAQDGSDDSQIKANIALQNFLVELYFENKKRGSLAADSSLEHLLTEIRKYPAKWWSISSMSELCNMSQTQFKRLFSKKIGLAPKRYIDEYKIKLAVEMLYDNEITVSGIADSLGYLDPYHFCRRFKQLTGYPPSKYRERFCYRH